MGEQLLPPQFLAVLRAIQRPFLAPIYDFGSAHMVFGRVVLIGDAAFLARPHVGMGVTKAAADARSLAHALMAEPDIPAALRRFESEREPIGGILVRRGRELGRFLAQSETDADLVRSYVEAREALRLELDRSRRPE